MAKLAERRQLREAEEAKCVDIPGLTLKCADHQGAREALARPGANEAIRNVNTDGCPCAGSRA